MLLPHETKSSYIKLREGQRKLHFLGNALVLDSDFLKGLSLSVSRYIFGVMVEFAPSRPSFSFSSCQKMRGLGNALGVCQSDWVHGAFGCRKRFEVGKPLGR